MWDLSLWEVGFKEFRNAEFKKNVRSIFRRGGSRCQWPLETHKPSLPAAAQYQKTKHTQSRKHWWTCRTNKNGKKIKRIFPGWRLIEFEDRWQLFDWQWVYKVGPQYKSRNLNITQTVFDWTSCNVSSEIKFLNPDIRMLVGCSSPAQI